MIRVYRHPFGADGWPYMKEFEDFDATAAMSGADGSLILTHQTMREVRDPANLAAPPRIEVSNPQLVTILAEGLWGRVDNLELSDAQAAEATQS